MFPNILIKEIWHSFETKDRCVSLIDEIDKADIEFPNDLLQELDKMNFMFTKPVK